MKVLMVAGARPNFMKIAPIYRAAQAIADLDCRVVHTGQHYDHAMSQAFFEDLDLPQPDYALAAGSGSHAVQTAKIMVAFEQVCMTEHPDLVMVVGDVNSTLACSIVAKKLQIQVAHVEAGLRSFDIAMPEEVNRLVTDVISDLFFVTEASAAANLMKEGKAAERIHLVGNVMVDNLYHHARSLAEEPHLSFPTAGLKKAAGDYVFLTLHRPANVDQPDIFATVAEALNTIAEERVILFPVHPRTRKMLQQHGIGLSARIKRLPPLGFREALFLWQDAAVVLTDSGGLQEETTALGVPCVTLRENTERPITVSMGTNVLAGTSRQGIIDCYRQAIADRPRPARVPPYWDGLSAQRIWQVLRPGNQE
ncbi:MAG: UDP-N-acetylglucosamine 2-epimerase (non-hydrolyzing) [Desulfosarcinaceae bacterium]|nr:UDP-N-acetylglucosamine 2-epimerase (non-hydrolyzing) [Desulfosarcinaceae bacterium]